METEFTNYFYVSQNIIVEVFAITFLFAILAFVEIEFSWDNQQIDYEKQMVGQSVWR